MIVCPFSSGDISREGRKEGIFLFSGYSFIGIITTVLSYLLYC